MRINRRNLFLYFVGLACLAALAYAVSFDRLPPADFTFVNGTEIQSIDPAIVTGVPEHRIISALFEGLYQQHPTTSEPIPALADRHDVSEDQRTYTFYLRKNCTWSDGSPITAHDFHWSWMRFLHPETAAKYSYQLYDYVAGAEKYAKARIEIGDPVEVELADRPEHPSGKKQLFPRGTMVRGILQGISKPPEPEFHETTPDKARKDALAKWKKHWVYEVDLDGKLEQYSQAESERTTRCEWVLYDFNHVGVKVQGEDVLQVRLKSPTPFFLYLMAFYTMYPVNRPCIETHGVPAWTHAEHLVSSGPFLLKFRRIRDRIRLVKNPRYRDAERVSLDTVDALAVDNPTTGLNLYLDGQADWVTTVPAPVISLVQKRPDFVSAPMLSTYFYRFNTNRPPLDDVRVRRALNLAIDKRQICESILRAGQVPARALVPPGLPGYPPKLAEDQLPLCGEYDVAGAQRLMAEAGYPGGKGFPHVEVLFNTSEGHRTIAEFIQSEWKKNLGINAGAKNQEWGVYLNSVHQQQYMIARAGWVGDYPDPNTFLDMFVTDGANNETGWSHAEYDALIQRAKKIDDPAERMAALAEAETILMQELPIIPLYFSVSVNMVNPKVEGFHPNIQDLHPLHFLKIKPLPSNEAGGVAKLP